MKIFMIGTAVLSASGLTACGGGAKEAKVERVLTPPAYEAPSNYKAMSAYKAAWKARILAPEAKYPDGVYEQYSERRAELAQIKLDNMKGKSDGMDLMIGLSEMEADMDSRDAKRRNRNLTPAQIERNKRDKANRDVKRGTSEIKNIEVSNCEWRWMKDRPYKNDYNAVYGTNHEAGYHCDMGIIWKDGESFGSWGFFVLNDNGKTYNFHGNLTGGPRELPRVVINPRLAADPIAYAEAEMR